MAPPRSRGSKVTKTLTNKPRRDSRRTSRTTTAAQEQPSITHLHPAQALIAGNGYDERLSEAIREGIDQANLMSVLMNVQSRPFPPIPDPFLPAAMMDSSNSSFSMNSDDSSTIHQSLNMDAAFSQQSFGSTQAASSFEVPSMPMQQDTPPPALNPEGLEHQSIYLLTQKAGDVAYAKFGSRLRIDSTVCERLADEEARREPVQRRDQQKLNTERRSNVEALLAHISGEESADPCKNCRKGHGPWKSCVVKDGQLCGSCTNCWFNASGSRCSFHDSHNPQPSFTPAAAQPTAAQQLTNFQLSNILQHLAQPPNSPSKIHRWQTAGSTSHLVGESMGAVTAFTKRDRHLARIQAAAKELGIRIAEYQEYTNSPEGEAEELHAQVQQQRGSGDEVSSNEAQSPPEAAMA